MLEGQEPREWDEDPRRFANMLDAIAVAQELLGGDDPHSDDWVCEVLVYDDTGLVAAIVNHAGTFTRLSA
jgi:hypothetical protein